jgi:hypothetical protein
VGTRTCSKCGQLKPDASFPWRDKAKGSRKRYCVACQNNYNKAWATANPSTVADGRHSWRKVNRERLKQWLRDFKSGKKCMDCNEQHPHFVLDFDHRDSSEKNFNVSQMVNGNLSLRKLQTEISKCDLICANCHRKRTFARSEALLR